MSKEVWKDVVGFEGLYKVSNYGNVYSNHIKRCLSAGTHKDGYKYVNLSKNGERKFKTIHRLVAEAFIPNPNNLPIINHRDENPSNNCVDNLEWCDYFYNATYNDVHVKRGMLMSKQVYGYNRDGELVYNYNGIREAAKDLGISSGDISGCCNNNKYTYYNIVWSHEKLTKEEVINRFDYSDSHKCNIKNSFLSRKVNQYDLDGNFICSYPSTQEAARQLHISNSLISRVCLGKGKQTHGWIFKYEDVC